MTPPDPPAPHKAPAQPLLHRGGAQGRLDVMTHLLQSHPDVDGVFAQNDELALGAQPEKLGEMAVRNAVQAAKKADVDKQVKVPVKDVSKDNVVAFMK